MLLSWEVVDATRSVVSVGPGGVGAAWQGQQTPPPQKNPKPGTWWSTSGHKEATGAGLPRVYRLGPRPD